MSRMSSVHTSEPLVLACTSNTPKRNFIYVIPICVLNKGQLVMDKGKLKIFMKNKKIFHIILHPFPNRMSTPARDYSLVWRTVNSNWGGQVSRSGMWPKHSLVS